jgi:hypothetical protein
MHVRSTLQSKARNARRCVVAALALTALGFVGNQAHAQAPAWGQTADFQGPTFRSIGIDGNTALIGELLPSPGVVHVITQVQGGNWIETSEITTTDANAGNFGWKSKVRGDIAVIGAPNSTGDLDGAPNEGAAYFYTRSGTGWTFKQKLTLPQGIAAGGDFFGQGINISPNQSKLVITAYQKTIAGAAQAGAVFVFNWNGTGWDYGQELTDPAPTAGGWFGEASCGFTTSNEIVVGERMFSANPTQPGKLLVYALSGGTWTLEPGMPIVSPAAAPKDYFGSASSNGSTIVAAAFGPGSPSGAGAAYVYAPSGGTWAYTGQTFAGNGDLNSGDQFGINSAFRGNILIVGAPTHTPSGAPSQEGAAYVYSLSNGTFSFQQMLTAPPAEWAPGAQFGFRTSVSGSTLLVEANGPNASGNHAAYFFGPATPVGSNVVANGPPGPTGSNSSVKFSTISGAGATNITLDSQCPTMPAGFLVTSNGASTCLTVSTNASYAGGVNVCVPLPTPAPASPVVIQCDPNPTHASCPVAGMDIRQNLARSDPYGQPLCCGYITTFTTPPGSDPICFNTQGLSIDAVGSAVPAGVPALGRYLLWLAGLLAAGGAWVVRRAISARSPRASAI